MFRSFSFGNVGRWFLRTAALFIWRNREAEETLEGAGHFVKRPFIVVSGLPGCGKSTLARQLSLTMGLPLLDKDDILERLFDVKGIGDSAWRRRLSRESDVMLEAEATVSQGAVLTSFWHLPGMAEDSGTPTRWLLTLSHDLVHVNCVCPPEIAAKRFQMRTRHAGHLDGDRTPTGILARIHELVRLGPLDIEPRVDVDTSVVPDIDVVTREIRDAFTRCRTYKKKSS